MKQFDSIVFTKLNLDKSISYKKMQFVIKFEKLQSVNRKVFSFEIYNHYILQGKLFLLLDTS